MDKPLIEIIQNFCKQRGLVYGICPADILSVAARYIEAVETPFVSGVVGKRTDPAKSMAGVKSIIVLGMGMASLKKISLGDMAHTEGETGETIHGIANRIGQNLSDTPHSVYTGAISSLAAYEDYHPVLKRLLGELAQEFEAHMQPSQPTQSFDYKILVDSGGLNERALAIQAGLGYASKAGHIISPILGSFWYIGLLLTNLELPYNNPPPMQTCPDDCNLCIKACPTGAIKVTQGDGSLETQGDGSLVSRPQGDGLLVSHKVNAMECISYLTQKPGPLTEKEMGQMGNQIYGCDICRNVCPHNKNQALHEVKVAPEAIINMDDNALSAIFEKTAANWRGIEIIKRNAGIVGANCVRPCPPR